MINSLNYALRAIAHDLFRIGINYGKARIIERIKASRLPLGHVETRPIGGYVPVQGRLVVQLHQAKSAGAHWDVRVVIPAQDRSISFVLGASKNKIKAGERFSISTGRVMKMIRQPDHSVEYADFEGIIEHGYGSGTVSKEFSADILITRLQQDRLEFMLDGRRVSVFKMDVDWGMNSSVSTSTEYKSLPKGKYVIDEGNRYLGSNYVAQDKIDGGNYTLIVDKDSVGHLISHRRSVSGAYIDRRFNIGNIYGGLPPNTVLQGEVWHEGGPYVAASILNSHPLKAYLSQKIHGKLRFTAWDINKYGGLDVSKLPQVERYKRLSYVGKRHNIDVVYQRELKNSGQLDRALRGAISKYGEGLVFKHKFDNSRPWIKVKPTNIINCTVIDVNQGSGRCATVMGSVNCMTDQGQSVQVGTGYSDLDRQWFWDNRDKLIGQIMEVEYLHQTSDSLRAPRYHRMSPTQ
jgi:hypothetical protein